MKTKEGGGSSMFGGERREEWLMVIGRKCCAGRKWKGNIRVWTLDGGGVSFPLIKY